MMQAVSGMKLFIRCALFALLFLDLATIAGGASIVHSSIRPDANSDIEPWPAEALEMEFFFLDPGEHATVRGGDYFQFDGFVYDQATGQPLDKEMVAIRERKPGTSEYLTAEIVYTESNGHFYISLNRDVPGNYQYKAFVKNAAYPGLEYSVTVIGNAPVTTTILPTTTLSDTSSTSGGDFTPGNPEDEVLTVDINQAFILDGYVRMNSWEWDANTPLGNQPVELRESAPSQMGWSTVETGRIDSNGYVSFTRSCSSSGYYRYRVWVNGILAEDPYWGVNVKNPGTASSPSAGATAPTLTPPTQTVASNDDTSSDSGPDVTTTIPTIAGVRTPLRYGEATSGSIDAGRDTDLFSVEAEAGDIILIGMIELSDTLNPDLTVFSMANSVLQQRSDASEAWVTVKTPIKGTYTIRAKDQGDTKIGQYVIFAQRLNAPGKAEPLQVSSIDGGITEPGQIRSYAVTGQSGRQAEFRVKKTSGEFYPQVWIFGPRGDDGGRITDSDEAVLNKALPLDGTYLLLVRDGFGGRTGEYQLFTDPSITGSQSIPDTITVTPSNTAKGAGTTVHETTTAIVPSTSSRTTTSLIPATSLAPSTTMPLNQEVEASSAFGRLPSIFENLLKAIGNIFKIS
ncbi:MAG: hypothetical protein ABFC38_00460 [Methanospirillum sp.]